MRSEDALESAIAQPLTVYFYGNGDLYEIAAAYAFHIAESQAYFDGNKRTSRNNSCSGAVTRKISRGQAPSPLPELAAYEAMIRVAKQEVDRSGLAIFFRDVLKPKS